MSEYKLDKMQIDHKQMRQNTKQQNTNLKKRNPVDRQHDKLQKVKVQI